MCNPDVNLRNGAKRDGVEIERVVSCCCWHNL